MLDISIHDMMINTKANILDAYGFAGLKVAKNKTEDVLAYAWKQLFHDEPAYFRYLKRSCFLKIASTL